MLLCATAFTTGFPEYRATYSVAPGRRELALTSPEDQDLDRIICPVLATGVKHAASFAWTPKADLTGRPSGSTRWS